MSINPRQLILKLLQASAGQPLSAREAVTGAAVLGLRENSVRVALLRLTNAGLIQLAGRGAYRLGPKAVALASEVAAWRDAEQRVSSWDGGWVAVYAGALGRSDRAVLRAHERALAVLGLRALERDLWLRPDNLQGGVAALRERLHGLGLSREAVVFRAHDLDREREQRARSLWDAAALDRHYREQRTELELWLTRADSLALDQAARESFLLGDAAIRSLVFDPLLPAPLVDVRARRSFAACVQRFDRAGHQIWRRLLAAAPARGTSAALVAP
ncbi:MAG TPA: PaaX family transcriptional regulator C-terminal domain-containing protein [Polyangiales bacterium]